MKYFRILDSFEPRGRWYLGEPRTQSGIALDPRLFTEGRKYEGAITYPSSEINGSELVLGRDYGDRIPFIIPIDRGETPLDFTLGAFDMPVVIDEIGHCLQAYCGDSMESFSAVVSGATRPFRVLNVLTLLWAVDEEHSEILWRVKKDSNGTEFNTYGGISHIVLKKKALSGATIFRLRGWEISLVVSETVKEILEKLGTTGITFKALEVI